MRNETVRSYYLLKLEALALLRGHKFGEGVELEIERVTLTLNIQHTLASKRIYHDGRRSVSNEMLAFAYDGEPATLEKLLDRLIDAQVKFEAENVMKGADFWDAYNEAERRFAPVTPRPRSPGG